jgi:hypothetical protein
MPHDVTKNRPPPVVEEFPRDDPAVNDTDAFDVFFEGEFVELRRGNILGVDFMSRFHGIAAGVRCFYF